jgi:16S rRNA (guanine527-N7)-methyltransferase
VKLDPEAVLDGLDAHRVSQLAAFADLLCGLGADMGLVSTGDRDRVWERHVLDSLRALACLGKDDRSAADVGSGGGLPGIPLAVARPDIAFVLVEPRGGRVAFLEKAVQELGLPNAAVVHGRAQDVPDRFDVCTARALGGPLTTWNIARGLLSPAGRVVYFAGRSMGDSELRELSEAGVSTNICANALFPGSGSLVIMQVGT